MTTHHQTNPPPRQRAPQRKPYHKPGFRFERVFETTALSCGKINATQWQCRNGLKSS
jgi:hypothetical protein